MNDTTTKTVEQLKQEAEEAATRLRQAEQEAREAVRRKQYEIQQAERKAEEDKLNVQMNAMLQTLADHLNKAGVPCKCKESSVCSPSLIFLDKRLNDYGGDCRVTMDRHYPGSGYYSSYTKATMKIIVGDYGNRKSYFVLKTGTFNFPGIVKEVKERIEAHIKRRNAERERSKASDDAAALVSEVYAELGIKQKEFDYSLPQLEPQQRTSYGAGGYVAPEKGKVFVVVPRAQYTKDEAVSIIRLFMEIRDKRKAEEKQ